MNPQKRNTALNMTYLSIVGTKRNIPQRKKQNHLANPYGDKKKGGIDEIGRDAAYYTAKVTIRPV